MYICFIYLELISVLYSLKLKNLESFCVFLYNIRNGTPYTLNDMTLADDNSNFLHRNKKQRRHQTCTNIKLDDLNAVVNANALIHGYNIDASFAPVLNAVNFNLPNYDFGITILMMFFAKYYSRGQYPLFVNEFRCIKELEILERTLLAYNQNRIQLPVNMATDKTYGLKSKRHEFVNAQCMTVQAFGAIMSIMKNPIITPEKFVECVKPLHIAIIESLYIFTSITRSCKIINECHELMYKSLDYTFQKCEKSPTFNDFAYWFTLPKDAIWFAHHRGHYKYSSYVSCDTNALLSTFDKCNIECIVVGFISQNSVYPLIFEDRRFIGNWKYMYDRINYWQFNNAYQLPEYAPIYNPSSSIHFVRNGIASIFKYFK